MESPVLVAAAARAETFGGSGFFIDKFKAPDTDGILWLHGSDNVFEKTLGVGEQIDIEPGGRSACSRCTSTCPARSRRSLFG